MTSRRSEALRALLRDRVPLAIWLAIAAIPGLTHGAFARDAGASTLVVPGEAVWEGTVNGLQRGRAPVLELSPAGDAFVYFQGAPWPRLMLRQLGEKEPRMLGRIVPFGRRRPRFDSGGRAVYFTAEWPVEGRSRPRRPPGGKESPVQPVVVRVSTDGQSVLRLAPPGDSSPGAFAVFLDLRPDGGSALVGLGSGLGRSAAREGDYSMELAEVAVEGETPRAATTRRLGFRISGHALARYSTDGRSILYTRRPARKLRDGVAVYSCEIAAGTHRKLDIDSYRSGTRIGGVVIVPDLRPHIGSFGLDPFTAYAFGDDAGSEALRFRIPADFPGAALAGVHPLGRTPERLLLRTGPVDRPRLVVCSWNQESAGAIPDLRGRSRRGAFPLISELARSLGTSAPPGQRVRVRWIQEIQLGRGTVKRTIAVEEGPGEHARIEKITAPENPADLPAREVYARDAGACSFTNDLGEVSRISTRTFQTELNGCSPLQLLVDPCGLLDPTLDYLGLSDAAEAEHPAIEFRYADAYHGRIYLKRAGERLLPERIVSPGYPAPGATGETTRAEKVVALDDFRPVAGRLLPHRITFDDGVSPHVMRAEEVSLER